MITLFGHRLLVYESNQLKNLDGQKGTTSPFFYEKLIEGMWAPNVGAKLQLQI